MKRFEEALSEGPDYAEALRGLPNALELKAKRPKPRRGAKRVNAWEKSQH